MSALPQGVYRYEPPPDANGSRASPHSPRLSQAIQEAAYALGFARAAIAPVARLQSAGMHLEEFRRKGFAADMEYLNAGTRDDPRELLPGARSIVAVLLAYDEPRIVPLRRSREALAGEVARYARGQDYHQVMKGKLARLAERIAVLADRPVLARACVDTAPLLEREVARSAGLGFQGKSAMLIAPGIGSYVLLGELLVDIDLAPSAAPPRRIEGCGSCRACLDACPTGAFAAPYVLDARRCLSYLTIEYSGVFPRELRAALGARVFGCDVCQETCPFNASERPRPVPSELFRKPHLDSVDLVELLNLGSAAYRKLVRGTALRRASRTTLQRNAAIALGNTGRGRAVAPLADAVRGHASTLVRAHAAWALGQLAPHLDEAAIHALRSAATDESDSETREEARRVLRELGAAEGRELA